MPIDLLMVPTSKINNMCSILFAIIKFVYKSRAVLHNNNDHYKLSQFKSCHILKICKIFRRY